jgi:hypothetical protein
LFTLLGCAVRRWRFNSETRLGRGRFKGVEFFERQAPTTWFFVELFPHIRDSTGDIILNGSPRSGEARRCSARQSYYDPLR